MPVWLIAMVAMTLALASYNYTDVYSQLPSAWRDRRGSFLTGTLLLASALLFLESVFVREHSPRAACLALALLNAALSFAAGES